MKNIQISQIKEDNFTCKKTIEQNIVIKKDDIHETHLDIKYIINDLLSIKDAVFFKQEKLKLELKNIENKLDKDRINELCKKLEEIEFEPLGKSKEVLQRNKEIYELKLINKILKYCIEIESGNINVLNALCKSEEKDDWKFLCFFIKTTADCFNLKIKNEILEIQKNIQKKLINVFEEGKKIDNKTMMRSAYIALDELDDQNTLIHTYIYDMDIFKKTYEMNHPKTDTIDIELYDEESNAFLYFMNDLKSSYQKHLINLSKIFNNFNEVYKIVNQKIFFDLIFPTLERFLMGTIPFVFLYSIENAYKNINNMCIYIESNCTNFDKKFVIEEFKNRFTALSIDKEREFFTEIFNKLVYGNKTQFIYRIYNEEIVYRRNYEYIIKIILELIDRFYARSKILYNKDDISDIVVFYTEKINILLDILFENTTDKIETIEQIQKIYFLIQEYFKDEIYKLDLLNTRVCSIITNALKWKIEQCEGRINQIISQIYFYRPESDMYILEYLKEQVFESKRMDGKVRYLYIEKNFQQAFVKYKERIFETRFSETQKTNLANYTKRFIKLIETIGDPNLIKLTMSIEKIVLLITIEVHNFQDVYNIIKYRLDKKDLEKAINCRKDKHLIKL